MVRVLPAVLDRPKVSVTCNVTGLGMFGGSEGNVTLSVGLLVENSKVPSLSRSHAYLVIESPQAASGSDEADPSRVRD